MDEVHELKSRRIREALNDAQVKSDESDYFMRKQQLSMGASDEIQRDLVYQTRDQIIFSDGVSYDIHAWLTELIDQFYQDHPHFRRRDLRRFILDNLSYEFKGSLLDLDIENKQAVYAYLMKLADQEMARKQQYFQDQTEQKRFYSLAALKAIDACWIKQVDNLQQLRQMVTMRTSAQRDPMNEYHHSALSSFMKMRREIHRMTIRNVLMSNITIDKNGQKEVYYV